MKEAENLAVENDPGTLTPRHVLQMSCGLSCELVLDEKTGQAFCIWSGRPTWGLMPAVLREYPRWRDEILKAWAVRHRKISVSIPTPKVVIGTMKFRGRFQPRNERTRGIH